MLTADVVRLRIPAHNTHVQADLSLEEYIDSNTTPRASRGAARGHRGARSFRGARSAAAPYAKSKGPKVPRGDAENTWAHDLFSESAPATFAARSRPTALTTGAKILISNLHYNVTEKDIEV